MMSLFYFDLSFTFSFISGKTISNHELFYEQIIVSSGEAIKSVAVGDEKYLCLSHVRGYREKKIKRKVTKTKYMIKKTSQSLQFNAKNHSIFVRDETTVGHGIVIL